MLKPYHIIIKPLCTKTPEAVQYIEDIVVSKRKLSLIKTTIKPEFNYTLRFPKQLIIFHDYTTYAS